MRIDTIALPSAPVASTSAPSAPKVSSQVASKLEPFLLIGKSARGAGARKLVEEVTSAPGVYYFGEILDLVGISEVSPPALQILRDLD
jgi:COP9 signalosome complex subunit 7